MPTLIWSKVKDGLDASVKKKAYAFLEKLQESDELPGLHIEPIRGSLDPRVRTGRVDDNYRCVMFKLTAGQEPFYVIHGVWAHDKANRIAEEVRLSMNPINGVPEVERVVDEIRRSAQREEAAETSAPPVTSPVADGPTGAASATNEEIPEHAEDSTISVESERSPNWPAGISAALLHEDLGIDPALSEAALSAPTEAALCEVIEHARVEWQGTALLELATGTTVEDVRRIFRLDEDLGVAADADEDTRIVESLKRPAAQASFHWITDDAELRRIIEAGDLGAWRLFLHPEQRTYAEGDRKGTFRLSGGAGTGKTVVAIHRACRLAKQDPAARILLTTYTRNLADDLAAGMRRLDETVTMSKRLGEAGVYVKGVDQVAWAVIQHAGERIADAAAAVLGAPRTDLLATTPDGLWKEAIADAGADLPRELATRAFFEAEYAHVILPGRITTQAGYLRVRRAGRGVALGRAQRAAVWQVVEAYRSKARVAGTSDYDEKAALAAEWLESQERRPFDHVIVDEAQDLAPPRLRFLRACVDEGPNDLFICEDSHQRIYGHRVVLGQHGINVRGGRSRRLTLNYRTTAQNLDWAMRVLAGADWSDLEGEQEEHSYRSARSGPAPLLVPADSMSEELRRAADVIRSWLPDPALSPEENNRAQRAAAPDAIAVLVRDRYRRESVVGGLAELGLEMRSVDREAVRPGKPLVMTMHRAKGLEFTHVLLFGVAEGSVPRSLRDYESSEADLADAMLRERALVYVASTRARDVLAVTWSGERSRLLG